jgi:hypothetical protein
MAHIRVTIQVGRYPDSTYDFDKVFPLEELIVEDCLQPIDVPSPNADAFSKMLCTPAAEVKTVKVMRKNVSQMISNVVSKAFMAAMEQKDMVMGYKKEDWERWEHE